MSYTHSREEAAIELGVSTRTLDRYVKSGKIRAQRRGKMVFIHDEDLAMLRNGAPELVRPTDRVKTSTQSEAPDVIIFDEIPSSTGFSRKPVMVEYRDLYEEAMRKISEKDRVIQDLSYRAGHAESELKNSVSMIEYKKQTFLLESAKAKTDEDVKIAQSEVQKLKEELMQSKFVLYLLISLVCVLLIASSFLFYFYM
jgi:excisionase family DNA binding protein